MIQSVSEGTSQDSKGSKRAHGWRGQCEEALECICLAVRDVDLPAFSLALYLEPFAPVVIDYTVLQPFREIAEA